MPDNPQPQGSPAESGLSPVAEPVPSAAGPASGPPGSLTQASWPEGSGSEVSEAEGSIKPQGPYGPAQPLVWLAGGALMFSVFATVALFGLLLVQGARTFWPGRIEKVATVDGQVFLGEFWASEPGPEGLDRRYVFHVAGSAATFISPGGNYVKVPQSQILSREQPHWAVVIERLNGRPLFGIPEGLLINQQQNSQEQSQQSPKAVWQEMQRLLPTLIRLREQSAELTQTIPLASEPAKAAPASSAPASSAQASSAQARSGAELLGRYLVQVRVPGYGPPQQEEVVLVDLAEVVRAYPANQLSWWGQLQVYLWRWFDFLTTGPRQGGTRGGLLPAIWGTAVLTLLMTVAVIPAGVLTALYLREYARSRTLVTVVRIAVTNLAGVPGIVFGVFGLGFFCTLIGGSLDELFYPDRSTAVWAGGGVLWAALTLALLTVPVVIVATEEGLASVPADIRAASHACGASRWQTIRRVVLPRALPGILTGGILAVARGAGEVAPLLLLGAAQTARELPIDSSFPYLHLDRTFMHLGYQVYATGLRDGGPPSPSSPDLVYTTTCFLVALIAALNLTAAWLRAGIRRHRVSLES